MADAKLKVLLQLNDQASGKFRKSFKKMDKQASTFGQKFKKNWLAITAATAAASVAISGLTRALKAAVAASQEVEGLQIRLEVLFGSVEEGNKVFKDMEDLAGRVPKTYQEIMQAATMMGGVVKGGSEEIKKLMPMIVDLSAATGISVQDVSSQMIRMYSAGAASADMFRERGVLAMLGFKAGVSVTAQETMAQVIKAWEEPQSKFRGSSEKLAKTWEGAMSMMDDAIFKLGVSIGSFITKNPEFLEAIRDGVTAMRGAADVIDRLRLANDKLRQDEGIKTYFAGIKEIVKNAGIANYGDTLERIFNIGVALSGQEISLPSAPRKDDPETVRIDKVAQEAAVWQARINQAIEGTELVNEIEESANEWKKNLTLADKAFFIKNEIEKNNVLMQMDAMKQKQREKLAEKNKKLLMAQGKIERDLLVQQMQTYADYYSRLSGALVGYLSAAQGSTKKYAKFIQGIRIGEAIMNTAAGVTAGLAKGAPMGWIEAAITAAMGALEIATIASQGFARGTDSVPATLTPGEMVVPRDFSSAIRAGDLTLGGRGSESGGDGITVFMENANFTDEAQADDIFDEFNEILEEQRRAKV